MYIRPYKIDLHLEDIFIVLSHFFYCLLTIFVSNIYFPEFRSPTLEKYIFSSFFSSPRCKHST